MRRIVLEDEDRQMPSSQRAIAFSPIAFAPGRANKACGDPRVAVGSCRIEPPAGS
jgi:hypothetical protein